MQPAATEAPPQAPAEPWRRRLTRTWLYGRDVDHATKSRARVGLAALDEHWETDLWVRNVADRRYLVDVFDQSPINVLQVWNAPRTFGVSLNYRFL